MEDTLNSRTAANIRAELAARRMTHAQLAERSGLSRAQVSALLREETKITLDHVDLIAEGLGLGRVELLLVRRPDPTPTDPAN